MADTLVFIPAWNEETSLPAVLTELRGALPEADVVVVDDGSTDKTADVARTDGAAVVSFPENRGLPAAVAAGYAYAAAHGYRFCGRVDGDGQHVAAELHRLLELVRSGACDVAVGSRFVSGDGYAERRYVASPARALATSGLYAVNERALPLLAEPFEAGAPEVEALIRLADAGLRIEEVPVDMRERAGGASKLRGRKALLLVLTVVGTVVFARRRRQR